MSSSASLSSAQQSANLDSPPSSAVSTKSDNVKNAASAPSPWPRYAFYFLLALWIAFLVVSLIGFVIQVINGSGANGAGTISYTSSATQVGWRNPNQGQQYDVTPGAVLNPVTSVAPLPVGVTKLPNWETCADQCTAAQGPSNFCNAWQYYYDPTLQDGEQNFEFPTSSVYAAGNQSPRYRTPNGTCLLYSVGVPVSPLLTTQTVSGPTGSSSPSVVVPVGRNWTTGVVTNRSGVTRTGWDVAAALLWVIPLGLVYLSVYAWEQRLNWYGILLPLFGAILVAILLVWGFLSGVGGGGNNANTPCISGASCQISGPESGGEANKAGCYSQCCNAQTTSMWNWQQQHPDDTPPNQTSPQVATVTCNYPNSPCLLPQQPFSATTGDQNNSSASAAVSVALPAPGFQNAYTMAPNTNTSLGFSANSAYVQGGVAGPFDGSYSYCAASFDQCPTANVLPRAGSDPISYSTNSQTCQKSAMVPGAQAQYTTANSSGTDLYPNSTTPSLAVNYFGQINANINNWNVTDPTAASIAGCVTNAADPSKPWALSCGLQPNRTIQSNPLDLYQTACTVNCNHAVPA